MNHITVVFFPKSGDFLINGAIHIKVGGKNKKTAQVKNESKYFLAVDDIEVGIGKQVPLWLFGFLY